MHSTVYNVDTVDMVVAYVFMYVFSVTTLSHRASRKGY